MKTKKLIEKLESHGIFVCPEDVDGLYRITNWTHAANKKHLLLLLALMESSGIEVDNVLEYANHFKEINYNLQWRID